MLRIGRVHERVAPAWWPRLPGCDERPPLTTLPNRSCGVRGRGGFGETAVDVDPALEETESM